MTAIIRLTRGFVTIVDAELFDELNQFKWYASGPLRYVRPARRNHQRKLIYMYHQVLGINPWELNGMVVDHINRDALDNRRSNLRIVTQSVNMQNGAIAIKSTGISIDRTYNTFKAYIQEHTMYGSFRKNVGTFKTREEAELALRMAKAKAYAARNC
jgi:hypothetical protein